jgi:hypothetical protein
MDNYDLARGPEPAAIPGTARGQRTPVDLARSRRVGLSRQVCSECGAIRHGAGDRVTRHDGRCSTPAVWERQRTGVLTIGETSTDLYGTSKFSAVEEAAV